MIHNKFVEKGFYLQSREIIVTRQDYDKMKRNLEMYNC
jgi:hypothetical protein